MKLNYYAAWHYHYIAKIKQPFKLWLKTKKQGKMKFFGEVMEDRMYDIPEADDNEEFQKWILEERKKMKKEDRQIEWKLDWLCYAGFYKGYKIFECFEWEQSQWEVNLILGEFKTKIGTYTTCKSAKRGAERFLKRLQEVVK